MHCESYPSLRIAFRIVVGMPKHCFRLHLSIELRSQQEREQLEKKPMQFRNRIVVSQQILEFVATFPLCEQYGRVR